MIYDMIIPPSLSLVQIATGNANFHELVFLVLAAGPAVAAALTNANAAG